MSQSYGKLKGRQRRSGGGGAWLWLLVGFLPGLLCGGLVIILLSISGVLGSFGPEPTPIYITEVVQIREIITTTPQEPLVVTATPEPSPTVDSSVSVIEFPTTTPSPDPNSLITPTTQAAAVLPSLTPEQSLAVNPNTALGTANTTTSSIPAPLAPIVSQLVPINGGIFEMGTTNQEIVEAARQCQERDGGQCAAADGTDSTPLVRVQLDPYQMETTEVSFAQYIAFLNWLSSQGQRHTTACSGLLCIQTTNENPQNAVITFDSANYNVPQALLIYPVYGVTWYGADAYCRAIGRRLPTEAEWEHAARTDSNFIYPWGNNWSSANANTRVPVEESQGPTAIGTYRVGINAYNLQDMAGNMAEWTQDWYDPNQYAVLANQPQPVVNPRGAVSGTQRVLRGGSWNGFPFFTRAVHRQAYFPVPDSNNADYPRWIGFRCAADATVQSSTTGGTSNVSVPSTTTGTVTSNVLPTIASLPTSEGGQTGTGDRG